MLSFITPVDDNNIGHIVLRQPITAAAAAITGFHIGRTGFSYTYYAAISCY